MYDDNEILEFENEIKRISNPDDGSSPEQKLEI